MESSEDGLCLECPGSGEPDDCAPLVFEVEAHEDGMRLDRFLAVRVEESRTRLKALILEGAVSLDGASVAVCTDPSMRMKSGVRVGVQIPPARESALAPQDIPLSVLYEDSEILVLDKPAGLVVHPAAGHEDGTLVNALLHHCGASLSGIGGVQRPGIVHRLDRDTSGVMIVAKTDFAHRILSAQLADRTLGRVYLTLVLGVPVPIQRRIDLPIGRHPVNRLKMAVRRRGGGRDAATRIRVIRSFGGACSLVACELETGRTHQIRVHMEAAGHPVVGDPLYGAQPTALRAALRRAGYSESLVQDLLSFPRQALHAHELHAVHPQTGDILCWRSELPQDMKDLIEQLEMETDSLAKS